MSRADEIINQELLAISHQEQMEAILRLFAKHQGLLEQAGLRPIQLFSEWHSKQYSMWQVATAIKAVLEGGEPK